MSTNPEDAPIFSQELTPGEVRAWSNLYAIETAHNALGEALTSIKEQFLQSRNTFVDELAKKYCIPVDRRRHVTYDRLTKRFVSAFHPELRAFRIDGRPPEVTAIAYGAINSAMRQLIQMALSNAIAQEIEHGRQSSTEQGNGQA